MADLSCRFPQLADNQRVRVEIDPYMSEDLNDNVSVWQRLIDAGIGDAFGWADLSPDELLAEHARLASIITDESLS